MNTVSASLTAPVAVAPVTLPRVVRSEWTKLWSTPSTVWSLLTTVVLLVGVGVSYATLRVSRPPADPSTFDAAGVSLSGVELAQVAIGVLGVLLVTGEYSTGLVRTSFAAVPRRTPLLWAKAVVLCGLTVAVCAPAAMATFLIGQSVLSGAGLGTSFGQPGVPRAVLGSALYLAVVGLVGLGLGALVRHTAGAISALFGLFFGLPILVGFLPGDVSDRVNRYLPGAAGTALTNVGHDPLALAPWVGFGVLCLYAAVLLLFGAARMRAQDP